MGRATPICDVGLQPVAAGNDWRNTILLNASLPIDAALDAQPTLFDSEGKDYAERVKTAMQRARAELELKIQTVQERQKAYYDANRRSADVYKPGEKVLVFRPTRKVGRAQKLLLSCFWNRASSSESEYYQEDKWHPVSLPFISASLVYSILVQQTTQYDVSC